MATVYLARAGGLEGFARHVVIKRIRPELAHEERFVKAFLEEARISASLHHQNIVQVHDIGDEGGSFYFAMEYVHGEDVRKLIHRARERNEVVPLAHVLSIVMATAAGLHHAHEHVTQGGDSRGVVHRDVAPANILIGYDGSVKIVDFGLARAAQRSTNATKSGTMKGKSSYMSPEQVTGKPVDRRTDVFALGIVLFELLTGQRLFKGATDFMTMAAIVDGQIPKPSSLRPDVPPALDEIVLRALARSPEARYQTAEALRESLEAFALAAELRTSAKSLADYLVSLFGERQEPWLVDAPETDDFDDETLTGVALASTSHLDLITKTDATAESPLRLAQEWSDEGEDEDEHEATAGQVPSLKQRQRDLAVTPTAPSPGLYSEVRAKPTGAPAVGRRVKTTEAPGSSTVVEPPIFDGGLDTTGSDDDEDDDELKTEIALSVPEHVPDLPKVKSPPAVHEPSRVAHDAPTALQRPAPRLATTPPVPPSPPPAPRTPTSGPSFAGVDPAAIAASFAPRPDPSGLALPVQPPPAVDLASYQIRSSHSRLLVIGTVGITVVIGGLLALRSCGGDPPRSTAAGPADAAIDAVPPRPDAAPPTRDAGVTAPRDAAPGASAAGSSAGTGSTTPKRPPGKRPPKRLKVR